MKKIILTIVLSSGILFCSGQNWDIDLAAQINPAHPDSRFWEHTSASAYWVSAVLPSSFLIMGLAKNNPCLTQTSVRILKAVTTEVIISELLKVSIDRGRPAERYPTIIHPYADLHGRSFPSGHTSLVFAEATAISIDYKKWYITLPLYIWASGIAYSRVYLGVHYPSDVLAGAIVGAGSAYLNKWINSQLVKRRATRKIGRL